MRRLFWLAFGATLGVLIFRRLSRAAERMTPQGIASSLTASLSDLGLAVREFAADVRDAMSAQETALRTAAGLDSGSTEGLAAVAAPDSAPTVDAISVEGPKAGRRQAGGGSTASA